jgi:hypothetical protein
MKFYLCFNNAHHKNVESIRKMLTKQNLDFVERIDLKDIDETYDVVMSSSSFFPPEAFPEKCKVIFGPQFFVFPEDHSHPLRTHTFNTDKFFYNTLSEWNQITHKNFWNDCSMNIVPIPFGIDTDSIQPVTNLEKRNKILIYFKHRHPHDLNYVINNIPKDESIAVFNYGSYSDSEYKRSLQETKFVIWIGSHESQGFAFQECMAMNIPILLWDVKTMCDEFIYGRNSFTEYKDKGFELKATTANVWSEQCGIKFQDKEDFEKCFDEMNKSWMNFNPRKEIEENVSLTVAYHNLLKIVGLEK